MKKAEIALGILVFTGIALTLLLIPGGAALSVLSISIISMFYMCFSIALMNGVRLRDIFKYQSFRGISDLRIIGSVGAGLALSTVTIGLLFKVMSWPGATVMLMAGLGSVAPVLVIVLIKYLETKSAFYRGVFLRLLIYGIPALVLFVLPYSTWVALRHRHYPDYVKAVKAASDDPDNEALQAKVDEEREKMFGRIPEKRGDIVEQLEAFRQKEKLFTDTSLVSGYTGGVDLPRKMLVTRQMNLAAIDFLVLARSGNATDQDYIDKTAVGLDRFKDMQLSSEDREQVCRYFQELMDIVRIRSPHSRVSDFCYGADMTEE